MQTSNQLLSQLQSCQVLVEQGSVHQLRFAEADSKQSPAATGSLSQCGSNFSSPHLRLGNLYFYQQLCQLTFLYP